MNYLLWPSQQTLKEVVSLFAFFCQWGKQNFGKENHLFKVRKLRFEQKQSDFKGYTLLGCLIFSDAFMEPGQTAAHLWRQQALAKPCSNLPSWGDRAPSRANRYLGRHPDASWILTVLVPVSLRLIALKFTDVHLGLKFCLTANIPKFTSF